MAFVFTVGAPAQYRAPRMGLIMQPELHLTELIDDGVAVVVIVGELDLATRPQLERSLQAITAGGAPRVVLDMADVTFCDVTSLRLLLSVGQRLASEGRQLVLRRPRPTLVRLLELIGIEGILTLQTDD